MGSGFKTLYYGVFFFFFLIYILKYLQSCTDIQLVLEQEMLSPLKIVLQISHF